MGFIRCSRAVVAEHGHACLLCQQGPIITGVPGAPKGDLDRSTR